MNAFLNSKLATALTLALVMGCIIAVMKIDAAHPVQWAAGAVALLGTIALSLASSLKAPPQVPPTPPANDTKEEK